MTITELTPGFVGEVAGIDITRPLTASEVAELEAGMDRYAVLVYHDQPFTDEQQKAFSRNFGALENTAGGNVTKAAEKRLDPEMADVSNLDAQHKPLARDDRRRLFGLGNQLWHSDSSFKPVPATTPPPLPPIGKLGQPGIHVTQMAVPQPSVMFGLPGIMRHDPDFIPGYVANYILGGGGFSSRLMDEVRVKRGLTYGIETQLSSYNNASIMVGSVATRADAVNQTISVVKDTLGKFAASGATQTELDDAKTYLTGSFPIAFASNAGIASQLSAFQRQGLDIGYVARRNSLIQAVTLDDVKRVAKRLYAPARLTVVVAGSPVAGKPVTERPKAPVRPTPPPVATAPGAVTPSPTLPAAGAPAETPAAKPAAKPSVPPVIKPRT